MMTDAATQDDRPARAKRSLASRIVWVVSILVILAGLLFIGLLVSIALVQREPYRPSLQIENQTDQTVTIYRILEPVGDRVFLTTIPPHTASTGGDCGSVEMIATTSDGTEIARRGPFEECHLERCVIQQVPGTEVTTEAVGPTRFVLKGTQTSDPTSSYEFVLMDDV